MAGINPIATYAQTNFTTQTGTVYKTSIDANNIVAQRVVDNLAVHQQATANMTVVVEPGHVFDGTTLTEIGAQTTITTTSGSKTATVASATGIANGMIVASANTVNNDPITISGATVTLTTNATATSTVAATFMQVTGTITAPGGNPRIDRIVADRFTGAISVITGTPAGTPVPPAITSGKAPLAQILLQTSSTSITNSMITDERDIASLGRGTGGEFNVGTSANNIVQLDGSAKLPAVDGSQLTNIVSVPTGAVFIFPANVAPSGYLELKGQLISRATFAALWTYAQASGNIAGSDGAWTIGQFSPGDGSTTFRIPDARGQFIRAWDDGAGVDSGRTIGSSQADAFKSHTHTVSDPTHFHTGTYAGVNSINSLHSTKAADDGTGPSSSLSTDSASTGITLGSTGSTETRPLNIAYLVCIKT